LPGLLWGIGVRCVALLLPIDSRTYDDWGRVLHTKVILGFSV